jgi:hypothetical protein
VGCAYDEPHETCSSGWTSLFRLSETTGGCRHDNEQRGRRQGFCRSLRTRNQATTDVHVPPYDLCVHWCKKCTVTLTRALSLSSLSSTHTHSLLQGLWGHCHDHPPTPLQQPASVHCSAARTSPRALTGWRLSTTSSVAHGPEAQPPSCPVLYSCGGDILRVIQSRRYR